MPVDKNSVVGSAVSLREPQIISNARQDPRFDDTFDLKTGFVTNTILCLPIWSSDDTEDPGTNATRTEGASVARGAARPESASAGGGTARSERRCIACLQLVNKLPKNVSPPAQFATKDVRAGHEFCSRLGRAPSRSCFCCTAAAEKQLGGQAVTCPAL